MHFQWVLLKAVQNNHPHKVDLIIKKGFLYKLVHDNGIPDKRWADKGKVVLLLWIQSRAFGASLLINWSVPQTFASVFKLATHLNLKQTIIQLALSLFQKVISFFVNTWWCWKRPRWEHLLKCNLSCKQHSSVRFFLEPEYSANLLMRPEYRVFQRSRPLTHHNYMF